MRYLLRRAGEMDPQAPRPRCVLDGAFAVVRRRLQAAKRADRRFDKLMLHEAASLTPLDPAWFTDQSVDYSREFNAVRGLEMASQAQRDAFSSSGSSVLETHMRTVGRSRLSRGGPEVEGELRGGDVAREGGGGVAGQRR